MAEFGVSALSKNVWAIVVGKAPKEAMGEYCQSEDVMKLVCLSLGISLASVSFDDKAKDIAFKSLFKAVTPKSISQLSISIEKSIKEYKKEYAKLSKDGLDHEGAHDKAIEQSLRVLITEITRSEVRNFVYVAAPKVAGVSDWLSGATKALAIRMMAEPAVGVLREFYKFGYDLQKKDFSITELIASLEKGFLEGIETSLFLEPGTFRDPKKASKFVESGSLAIEGAAVLDKAAKKARVFAAILDKAKEVPLKGKNLSTDPIHPHHHHHHHHIHASNHHKEGLRQRRRVD